MKNDATAAAAAGWEHEVCASAVGNQDGSCAQCCRCRLPGPAYMLLARCLSAREAGALRVVAYIARRVVQPAESSGSWQWQHRQCQHMFVLWRWKTMSLKSVTFQTSKGKTTGQPHLANRTEAGAAVVVVDAISAEYLSSFHFSSARNDFQLCTLNSCIKYKDFMHAT